MLEIARPPAIGFDPLRLERVYDTLALWVGEDRIPAAGIAVGRHGKMLEPRFFGRQHPEPSAPPLRNDAIFLVASVTKPLTALAAVLLVERGRITLDDPVGDHVPEFAANGKDKVRVRHLLTHTSGLPDMLPNNEQLRQDHQPLDAFVRAICELPLDFEPGTRVQYQSTGFAMLADIVRRVSGRPLAPFLADELFRPLGLIDTALGAPDEWWTGEPPKSDRFALVRVPGNGRGNDWQWNSRYWRSLGAPWGGLLTTPAEFAVICQLFLDALRGDGPTAHQTPGGFGFSRSGSASEAVVPLLSAAAARAMTTNQLTALAGLPDAEARARPWGLGWRLNWPGHSANFGDLLGPRAFGHWGATGTLVWMDPDAHAFLVLFTTEPQEPEGPYLARISNLVCAALA
jgi:CubicO group peptidase (beta-lactamase class C family)